MSSARVIKQKPVETKNNLEVRTRPARNETKPTSQVKRTCPRRTRTESCPRSIHSNGNETTKKPSNVNDTRCTRRARSASTAPKSFVGQKVTGVSPKSTDISSKSALKSEESSSTEQKERATGGYCGIQSHKAFTVIPPNPKKRKEIQKKAEAELAALEDLRLSRAMAYVSINPSSVGGCLSLEEVRLKQQKEMEDRRRQRKMKKYLLEPSPVVL